MIGYDVFNIGLCYRISLFGDGHVKISQSLSYDVLQDGRLGMITQEDESLATTILKPIRILAKVEKGWVLDPNPDDVHPWWDLWVVGKKSLCELE